MSRELGRYTRFTGKLPRPIRVTLMLCALLLGLWVLNQQAAQFVTPKTLLADDYVEYWATSRLNMNGGNPYSMEQVAAVQKQIGRAEGAPLMMWNPPWTLALTMPFALLPYPNSRLFWYLMNVIVVLGCATWLWDVYGGARQQRWVAWLVAFTFGPTLHVLKLGQISALLLAGIVGFCYFEKRRNDWLAGACAALVTVKPHLLYIFLIALLFWGIEKRRWQIFAGFGMALLLLMTVAWVPNPALLHQYQYAVANYPPVQHFTPTFGGILRNFLGVEHVWLQFVAPILGMLWFTGYWLKTRPAWNWLEQLPRCVLVSVMTAAYGWVFDQTVSLFAFIPVAVSLVYPGRLWQKVFLLSAYLIVNWVVIAATQPPGFYWWLSPVFLILFWSSQKINWPLQFPGETKR
ncbi:MAG: glycosyltransferase family 87 protein [Chloroflexota bacterium]